MCPLLLGSSLGIPRAQLAPTHLHPPAMLVEFMQLLMQQRQAQLNTVAMFESRALDQCHRFLNEVVYVHMDRQAAMPATCY